MKHFQGWFKCVSACILGASPHLKRQDREPAKCQTLLADWLLVGHVLESRGWPVGGVPKSPPNAVPPFSFSSSGGGGSPMEASTCSSGGALVESDYKKGSTER